MSLPEWKDAPDCAGYWELSKLVGGGTKREVRELREVAWRNPFSFYERHLAVKSVTETDLWFTPKGFRPGSRWRFLGVTVERMSETMSLIRKEESKVYQDLEGSLSEVS